MSDFDVEWEDPPPPNRRRKSNSYTTRFIEQLRAHPGKWAVYKRGVRTSSSVSAYKLAYPYTEWVTRNDDTGTKTLYARWVGEEVDPAVEWKRT